ncbi:hypothetical protein EHS25_007984 [Saitozyma podzolica]|uniref:Uncharacterized protein n=1 Tax=Saitozyma podzolica TaxID=1890683 RepID=A0A427YNB6_9TREE|nr:hypothetical protein EHS25_007984 [Saitozyma podzolica]
MSMESKTHPSASASTTSSPESEQRDPAVVALMGRLHSRDTKDHASFIMRLYGTDTPGGKAFAKVIEPGWRTFSGRTLTRKNVNETLESSALGISLGRDYAGALLGKLHTDQENVPESIVSWGGSVHSNLSFLIKDELTNEYTAFLGPEELRVWPPHDENEHATMTWKTAFNLLSPDEPTDILEPGQSLPAPPPRYIWRGSYERVDNIGKAMHDAIDSALQGPQTIPGGNTWGTRTIYRLEPDYDTEREFEDHLSKESQQFLDRVKKSTDLCDLVLSAFNLEPGSDRRVNDFRQELNIQLGRKVYDNSSNLKQTIGEADKTSVGDIATSLHGLSRYLFDIVDGVVRKQYDVKHGEDNMYSVVPYSLRGLVHDGPTLAKMRWDKTFNVLSSQHQELESVLSSSPPTWDGRNTLLVYPASQPPSGRHQTAFSMLQTAIKKAREGPKLASQVSKEELAQSDSQWRDEYNRSTAMTSSSVDAQSTPSKASTTDKGKGALRSLFSRR